MTTAYFHVNQELSEYVFLNTAVGIVESVILNLIQNPEIYLDFGIRRNDSGAISHDRHPDDAKHPSGTIRTQKIDTDAKQSLCQHDESLSAPNDNSTKIIIACPEPLINTLDDLLWTHSPDSFLPHGIDDEIAPIVLTTKLPTSKTHAVINLTDAPATNADQYEHLHEIAGLSDAHKAVCREKYKAYKKSGLEVIME